MNPTCEQKEVIKNIKKYNVLVNSVAGSGKTTTNLLIAKEYPNKNILLLTYNRKLRDDTVNKAKTHEILNLQAYTYHSFAVRYYKPTCYTDTQLNSLLIENLTPLYKYNFDIIIIDEAQDITPLYYKLLCKIYYDNKIKDATICITGDEYQSIYGYNRATSEFIKRGNIIFNFNNYDWKKVNLSHSFRITAQIAEFVNKCMIHENRIIAKKEGSVVDYVICNTFEKKPYELVKKYLKKGYMYDDIFILAPSLKSDSRSAAKQLIARLTEDNIPLFVPSDDSVNMTSMSKVLENKIVFSTFHQVKGLERKVVIVFNFDDSYFEYYDSTCDKNKCPNTIYVACTRSLEKLILLHHEENNYLKFLKQDEINKLCEVTGKLKLKKKKNNASRISDESIDENVDDVRRISVVNLIKHLPFDVIKKIKKCFDIEVCSKKGNFINLTNVIEQQFNKDIALYEIVNDINGLAIPFYYECKTTGKCNELEIFCKKQRTDDILENYSNDETNEEIINIKKITINDILKKTVEYSVKRNMMYYKLNQIKTYDWIGKGKLDKCMKRLKNLDISINAEYEKEVYFTYRNFKISGRVDCVNNNEIYEFKCVRELDEHHTIQLAVYMFLIYANQIAGTDNIVVKQNKKKQINTDLTKKVKLKEKYFYLYNILDNNMIYINSDIMRLKKMIDIIIDHRMSSIEQIECESFEQKMLKIKKNYSDMKNNDKIMILDIETDGFNTIVQISWLLCDKNYNIISKHNYYNIEGNDYYGKIDKKVQKSEGLEIKDLLLTFLEGTNEVRYIIGHNVINFDLQMISNNLEACDIDCILPESRDLMVHTKYYFGYDDVCGNPKPPKLSELYGFLCNNAVDNKKEHTGDYDIDVTLECVKKLKDNDYDIIDKYREYAMNDYKIKKIITYLDKNKIFSCDINRCVYCPENKKFISIKQFFRKTYKKYSKKTDEYCDFYEIDYKSIKYICKKYDISVEIYDKNGKKIYVNESKNKKLLYLEYKKNIFPINNIYFNNEIQENKNKKLEELLGIIEKYINANEFFPHKISKDYIMYGHDPRYLLCNLFTKFITDRQKKINSGYYEILVNFLEKHKDKFECTIKIIDETQKNIDDGLEVNGIKYWMILQIFCWKNKILSHAKKNIYERMKKFIEKNKKSPYRYYYEKILL